MSSPLSSGQSLDPARTSSKRVEQLPVRLRNVLDRRAAALVSTLTGQDDATLADAWDVVQHQGSDDPGVLWLAHAVLVGRLPTEDEMDRLLTFVRLRGVREGLAPFLARLGDADRLRDVEIVRGGVLCDVNYTARSDYLSGIQRVVRETASRWRAAKSVTFVGWDDDTAALRPLRDTEYVRMFHESPPVATGPWRIVVPWQSTHLVVELMDRRQSTRLTTLARYSANQVGVVGYDSIPVTSASTVADGTTAVFARWLAAARQADRAALISEAAANEFRGVLDMGAGRSDRGPDVLGVPLAVEARETNAADLAEAAAGLLFDGLPMVLVVGSHEPRKNHLAVLHAAEVLWREGLRFNLVFVGAGSWKAESYDAMIAQLGGAGRPVQSIRTMPDRLLWAAYRLAHCTMFPSLNEGFGLPVAESLAAGTPVITSSVGSMREIVAPQGVPLGGLLVDPRDDSSVTAALRTMLTDSPTYQRLKAETTLHPPRSWDDYAEEVWSFLVGGVQAPSQ